MLTERFGFKREFSVADHLNTTVSSKVRLGMLGKFVGKHGDTPVGNSIASISYNQSYPSPWYQSCLKTQSCFV